MNNINMKLVAIQEKLKAPKGQRNNFGNYNYRNAEDILEAVKPLCVAMKAVLTISDEMIMLGDRFYVKATATLTNAEDSGTVVVSAYAREPEEQKGMNAAQITGSASSYARKYALNGLFSIDDTKDADSQDNRPVVNNDHQREYQQEPVTEQYQTGLPTPSRTCECGQEVYEKTSKAGKQYYKCDNCGSWVN